MAIQFDTDATDPDLDARVRALVDERMIAAYWDAAAAYKTQDLVVVFSEDEANLVEFFPRQEMIAQPGMPEFMRRRLSKPARDAKSVLSGSDAAFWLFAMFSDEKMACVAVKAKRLSAPGSA